MAEKRVALGESREVLMATLSPSEMDGLRTDPTLACIGAARSGDLFVRLSDEAWHDMRRTVGAGEPLQAAGVLLGEVRQAADGFAVHVMRAIPFEQVEAQGDRVRISRHAWLEVLKARAGGFAKQRIVGWFHGPAGLGSQISDTDRFVQRFFFPAEWQVACVLDTARSDVRFFQRRGRQVTAVAGFYASKSLVAELKARGDGPVPSVSTDIETPAPLRLTPRAPLPVAVPVHTLRPVTGRDRDASSRERDMLRPDRAPTPERKDEGDRKSVLEHPPEPPRTSDNYLRDRFVERSLEKIVRLLQEPPPRPREYVLMGMMALMLILLIATRPSGHSSPQLTELSQKLDQISDRLAKIESRPAPEAAIPAPRPASPGRPKPPAPGQSDTTHRLQDGETLWSISETYYNDGSLMGPLMRYNTIESPEDLKAGESVRIPSKKKLLAFAKASKPTPKPRTAQKSR